MDDAGRDAALARFLSSAGGDGWVPDTPRILPNTTAYLVRTFDGEALQFSFPLLVKRDLWSEIPLDPAGSDGATAALIEQVKEQAHNVPELGPLYGRGTQFSFRCSDIIEPYTIVHSDNAIGSHLWKADARNFTDHDSLHLVIRGALPDPDECRRDGGQEIIDQLTALASAISAIIKKTPLAPLRSAWLSSLDQKLLRELLNGMGLVAFVSDGSRLARTLTHHRCFFRVAGPKAGVNVPFTCPKELDPVEIELPASNRAVTGLGIRRREVLAIAGSNAQGKSTFLEAILAGMDDHAPHDGRELVVTAQGAAVAESTNMGLAGADISMFFAALPPGISGSVKGAFGAGSGSMTMAYQVQNAITCHAPLLIIDEDRAAPNLLVHSCLQKEEITPLAELLAHQRERLGGTALVFAACAMDTLIAEADRIMVLDRHEASAIDPRSFRRMLAGLLRDTANCLDDRP